MRKFRFIKDPCEKRDITMASIMKRLFDQQEKEVVVRLSNGSIIKAEGKNDDFQRGNRANQIYHPFINEEGNGCCTNILTGETYLD